MKQVVFNQNQVKAFELGDFYKCFGLKANFTRNFVKPSVVNGVTFIDTIVVHGNSIRIKLEKPQSAKIIVPIGLKFYFLFFHIEKLHDGWDFILNEAPDTAEEFDFIELKNLKISDYSVGAEFKGKKFSVSYVHSWPYKSEGFLDGFERKALLHASLGKPSLGYGVHMRSYDRSFQIPRLPNPPFLFLTNIDSIDIEGKTCVVSFDATTLSSFLKKMPFTVFLEAALQPCGWFTHHLGLFRSFKEEVFFRNLRGKIKFFQKQLKKGFLKFDVNLTNKVQFGQTMILSFKVSGFQEAKKILELETEFGFFTKTSLEKQVGLNGPSLIDLYSYKPVQFDGSRIVDDIVYVDEDIVWGRKVINPDDWYFKAHFLHDPVQPGSLGIQALLDLWGMHPVTKNYESPAFIEWKYRGQILPKNKVFYGKMDLKEKKGWIYVDEKCIYEVNFKE